ncbi:MAG: protein kinase [Bryobacteraceae bacterium]|nr:protein kinase [Bryobacteraceae bacterium]
MFSEGQQIGEYVVLGYLGQGGMGTVYRARHSITGREEALKAIRRDSAPDRFLREIQIQARLSHPNIAAVRHAFEHQGDLVLVLELVEGKSLRQILHERRLSAGEAIEYAEQILAAITHAHAHGIIHRDLSPGNVLVDADGVLKLTDFGLAKSDEDMRLTRSGVMVGSVLYASPEQIRGQTTDVRSDLYSCGAVFHELFTGRPPYQGEAAFDVMTAHCHHAPPDPGPDVPEPWRSAIRKALEKDPAHRPQSAAAFITVPPRSRRPWPATMAAGLAVALLAVAWIPDLERMPPYAPPVPGVPANGYDRVPTHAPAVAAASRPVPAAEPAGDKAAAASKTESKPPNFWKKLGRRMILRKDRSGPQR